MRRDSIDLWIAGLRCGSYTQGEGYLKRLQNGKLQYCATGVACEILSRMGNIKSFFLPDGTFYYGTTEADIVRCGYRGMPQDVREWLEISESLVKEIQTANDEGMSFDEIANILELKLIEEIPASAPTIHSSRAA